jgi:hypothetical protein
MCSLEVHTECETCETIPNYPGLSSTILAHLWCKCVPWMVHTECETCETIPTILDCPQLSWPTFGVNVSLGGTCTDVRHDQYPNYPGCPTILAHLWCKCVPWEVHAPNVRHVRPSQLSWTVLNYPGHLWCKCVPWVVHAAVETCETIPTILDCPQLSWPTFGVNVFLGWYMHRM